MEIGGSSLVLPFAEEAGRSEEGSGSDIGVFRLNSEPFKMHFSRIWRGYNLLPYNYHLPASLSFGF